jgi:hypothetical protein
MVKVHIQLNTSSGLKHPEVTGWVYGASEEIDVAVAPFRIRPADLLHQLYPLENFLTRLNERPYMGDPVYFIGLLAFVPEMHRTNIPMVRSGTLGAMNQRGIPMRLSSGFQFQVEGHLIDCRSWGGFSGSPCLIQNPATGATNLLGIISAHFDATKIVTVAGTDIPIPIHAGVGVVTPIEPLLDLLADKGLAKMREEDEREHLSRLPDNPAVMDSLVPTPLERMSDLTSKLFQVPKDEADEVHRGHQE